ncbi:uncharacterized protein [Euwallacea similis]|uniref:uncharacterized protein isoform X1 n=1 Tax=Euwallacea similis TaxID=1736056 RepID=UPI00344EC897
MLPNALFWRLLLRVSVLLFFIRAVISTDEYVKDLRKKCMKTKRPFFCVTFRIAKYVQEFDYHGPPYGPLKLVKIKQEGLAVGDLLPTPRFVSTDTEWDKFVKFLQRKLVNFVTSHGIAFEVPQGIQVVGERSFSEVEGTIQDKSHEGPPSSSEKHNKHHHNISKEEKKLIWWITPILLLIKLYMLKVALHTILFGVVVLKLLVFKGALWLPYLAHEVKRVCLKQGLLQEVWNGLWQKRMDLKLGDPNLQYFGGTHLGPVYNDSYAFIPPM